MGKAIAGFMIGLVCLFLFSITLGSQMFSSWERRLSSESRLENKHSPGLKSTSEKESQGKKFSSVINSFDLANGLTLKELEDLSWEPKYRFSAFLTLVASLWMVALIRKPRDHKL